MGKEVCRATVRTPGELEVLNRDVSNGFDSGFAESRPGIVEENGRATHLLNHSTMQFSSRIVRGEVSLEALGFDIVLRSKLIGERRRLGRILMVVDGN